MMSMTKEAKKCGTSYAFMDLGASKEQIEDELPRARKAAVTPSQLEISVRTVKDFLADKTTDKDLVKCVGENSICPLVPKGYNAPANPTWSRKLSDLKYVIEARYPHATNEQAAAEITDVSKHLYDIFGDNKPFYFLTINKAPNGEYLPWEKD